VLLTGHPKSTLARQCEVVLDVSVAEEACPMNLAPTASTTAALAAGDALAMALLELRALRPEDYAAVHPRGTLGWPAAKGFAQAFCAQMAADSPDRYVVNMAKRLRTGKIFLDYLRNDAKATAVAPLSPRAREGATVSMPVNWNLVKKGLDPADYTVRTASALIRRSRAWAGYDKAACALPPEFLRRRP